MSNSEMHVVNPVRNYSFHQESCQKDDNAEKSYDQGINQTCIQPLKSPDEHISKNIYGFDIQEVLTANVTTKKIVTTKVEENQFILRSDRQAVAAVLIDAVIERSGTNPSKNSLEQLARQLVRKYPGLGDPRRSERGWQMWFFHTVKGQGATGFLEDRLKNQRRRLVKKQTKSDRFMEDAEDINWQSMDEDDDPVPDDAKLEYLKHNFGPDIPTVMKVTVFMRRSLLRAYQREQFIGLQKAMEKMPRLFDTENMIVQDFNIRHPAVSLILYERWPKVSRLLLEYAEESGICYKKKLDIAKHRYDLSESDICLIAFCLLPFILPSCGRKLTSQIESDDEEETTGRGSTKRSKSQTSSRKRQSTVKASDLDSLRSMICFKPVRFIINI
ncbi:unnamed protein product [Orchesella dallaii]|uniref:Uncharacterized protein n=2 Tax=Orchesella dallaii TaxID=48710 RepID=A0ABP1QNX3_9HEXA